MARLKHAVRGAALPCIKTKHVVANITLIVVIMFFIGTNALGECTVCTMIQDSFGGFFGVSSLSGQVSHNNTSAQNLVTASNFNSEMLLPITEVDQRYTILDVSENPDSYINGAIHIPYTYFLDDTNTLRPIQDLAKIFGYVGISRNDSIGVYGECMPCGGGPSTATFVYWLLRYLGHDDVRVIDGGMDAWVAAGLPVSKKPLSRPRTTYTPNPRLGLLANYSYVKSGHAQIVDARPVQDFKSGSIPGTINIPYDDVQDGKRVKENADLEKAFGNLTKEKPVVVFTATGIKASVVWFALTMMGYDAMLYSYQDWVVHKKMEDSNVPASPGNNETASSR
jgi:thiosulfate/3-mercaptopyruvate sulfurtransferase